jgi:hypothetical protein
MHTCSRRRIENKPQSWRATALLAQRLRALGPYALLEIVLPGGTLLALSLYAYRRWTGTATDLSVAQPFIATCAAALFVAMVAFGRFCAAKPPMSAQRAHCGFYVCSCTANYRASQLSEILDKGGPK